MSENIYKIFNVMVHLGSEKSLVRISTFYILYHLLESEEDPNLRKIAFDILCMHLRQTTKDTNYRDGAGKLQPTEEIQILLDILFNPPHPLIFSELKANLAEAYLKGARLEGANLRGANLQKAILQAARLKGANLRGANLENADMLFAETEGADMEGVIK